jgi:uncharacterized phage protein (TIGR01671 family)
MRDILFRGKRVDNGDWIVGQLLRYEDGRARIVESHTDIFCYEKDESIIQTVAHEVIPETVGQFTGLTDKNGTKVFEGDIVEVRCHSRWRHDIQRCEVAYGRDGFECRHHIGGIDTDYYTYRVLFSKDVVVIGNIHDNPELLENP